MSISGNLLDNCIRFISLFIQELLELLGWIRKYQDNLKNMTRWILQYANETKQQLEKIEHLKAIEEEELRKI